MKLVLAYHLEEGEAEGALEYVGEAVLIDLPFCRISLECESSHRN